MKNDGVIYGILNNIYLAIIESVKGKELDSHANAINRVVAFVVIDQFFSPLHEKSGDFCKMTRS